jgi:alkanesulfonate monooxygenase SsuD/methylene tetrahydromethanopterin reductase-like flavin-dependent oxidoreductase (luciferase family)
MRSWFDEFRGKVTKRSIVFAVPEFLPLIGVAQEAERSGFDRIWTTENPSRDGMIRALTLGMHTETIGIATGIAYAFTRAPLAMAAAAADVNEAIGGRFSLGLGAGTQGMRSRWYGIDDWDHAGSRLEEYAMLLREIWGSPRAFRHEGRFYKGAYSELDGARQSVPIWGSGINSAMLRISARSCEGVAVHPLGGNVKYLDKVVLPAIAEGAASSELLPELALWRVTSIDDDAQVARARARNSLAFYFSTPSYAGAADETGWGDVAKQVREMYRERGSEWDSISKLIPDEMVSEFCLAGDPDSVGKDWAILQEEYESRGVTETVFQAATAGTSSAETVRILSSIVEVFKPVPDTVS